MWIGTNNGIYYYNHETDTIIPLQCDKLNSKTINSLLFYNDSILIASTNKGFNKIQLINNNTLVLKVYTYNNTNGFIWSRITSYNVCYTKLLRKLVSITIIPIVRAAKKATLTQLSFTQRSSEK